MWTAWPAEILSALDPNWNALLWGLFIFLCTFIGSMVLMGIVLVRLPADCFCDSHPRDFWNHRHPAVRWAGVVLKNLLGVLLVVFGIVLSLPGVPGPGFLVILLGIMLADFPGKRRLKHWLLHQSRVLNSINRLRQRYGRPPLVLENLMSRQVTPHDRTGNQHADDRPPPMGPFGDSL